MTAANVFEVQQTPEYATIRFFGHIDAHTVTEIKPTLQRALGTRQGNLIIDLDHVDFLDSHGVGLFVSLLKQAHRDGGKLVFAGAAGQPASVLQMVGFNGTLVTYCDTLGEARAQFPKAG